jgi:hypothetical protein
MATMVVMVVKVILIKVAIYDVVIVTADFNFITAAFAFNCNTDFIILEHIEFKVVVVGVVGVRSTLFISFAVAGSTTFSTPLPKHFNSIEFHAFISYPLGSFRHTFCIFN